MDNAKSQENQGKNPEKLRIHEKHRGDFSIIKNRMLEVLEQQCGKFNLDSIQKSKAKSMCFEYLNLILKIQRQCCEYIDSEGSDSSVQENQDRQKDSLFEEKSALLQRTLAKKIDQCEKTPATQMVIDLDIQKPDHLFTIKNGAEVPIESDLDFTRLEEFPKKIEQLHERQHYYCNFYRQLLEHQRWLSDKNE